MPRTGARLVDFAGWEMPVQYRSILEEHKAVRRAAGLFDVSHMGEFEVRGPEARQFLNRLVTNDVAKLFPGRVLYSPMCAPDGGVVDDLLVYLRDPDDYLSLRQCRQHRQGPGLDPRASRGFAVTITDRSADYALLAVQGPRAVGIVQALTGAKLGLIGIYHFTEGTVAGVHCLISRTGYTGEDGFELYHAAGDAPALAEALLAAGQPHGPRALRPGRPRQPAARSRLSPLRPRNAAEISPLDRRPRLDREAGQGGRFCRPRGPARRKAAGRARKVVLLQDRRPPDRAGGYPRAGAGGAPVGRVLSGTLSPILGEAIGSALVRPPAADGPLTVDIRGASIALQIVKPPFVELKKTV